MKNPKIKGGSFERLISKKLSLWWSNNLDDSLFWRTSSSGGRFTQRLKKNKKTYNQDGDICGIHPESFLFSNYICIECKHYKSIDFFSTINDKGLLVEWWSKLSDNCSKESKYPFLVVKLNNKPILLLTNLSMYNMIKNNFNDLFVFSFKIKNEWVYGLRFEDFIRYLDANTFKKLLIPTNMENKKYDYGRLHLPYTLCL